RAAGFEFEALRFGRVAVVHRKIAGRQTGGYLRLVPFDVEDRERVAQTVIEAALQTHLVVIGLVRLIARQRRALLEGPGERHRVGATAAKSLRPKSIDELILRVFVGRIDL